MSKSKTIQVSLIVLAMVLSMITLTQAQSTPPKPPGLPSSYYGELHFMDDDGIPKEGDLIKAYLGDGAEPIAEKPIIQIAANQLAYAIRVPQYADDMALVPITFKVGERVIAAASWESGTNRNFDIHPPKADAGGPYQALVNEEIQLSGSAVDYAGSDQFEYAWDLTGDGIYDDSYLQNPTTSFTQVGEFKISLKVINPQGGQGFADAEVVVIVSKQTAEVSLSNLSHIYDGTAKGAIVTTNPPGLDVTVTYNGSTTEPVNAGSYAVTATIVDDDYQGSAQDTLIIAKATAAVTLSNLSHTYDGTPKAATAATSPPGLTVSLTYDGNPSPPTNAGSYDVLATVTDDNYQGSASGTLVITQAEETDDHFKIFLPLVLR